MSVTAPKNTLMYQRRGRPLGLLRNIGGVGARELAKKIRAFESEYGAHAKPETEAIQFYVGNHAMKELEFNFGLEEPLPDWAMEIANRYHKTASLVAMRAFYYLMLITAREARHNSSKQGMNKKMIAEFGAGPAMALLHYPDTHSLDAVASVLENHAGDAPIGEVSRSLAHTFYNGSFPSSYGGPKWGNVADCLVAFVTGKYSAETMLDTVWTLVHNGGPIFNKSMLYDHYDAGALQMVLDIQRGGMIPRLILTPYGNPSVTAEAYVTPAIREFAEFVAEHLPYGDFKKGVRVDFNEIEKLGAIGNYHYLIQQIASVPPPVMVEPKAEPDEKTHYIIAKKPGMMFKKLTRAELGTDYDIEDDDD